MSGPAAQYARITKAVGHLAVDEASTANGIRRPAYMIARAALLLIRAEQGDRAAAEAAFQLADELATFGGAR